MSVCVQNRGLAGGGRAGLWHTMRPAQAPGLVSFWTDSGIEGDGGVGEGDTAPAGHSCGTMWPNPSQTWVAQS